MVPRSTLPGIVQNRALARILDERPDAWWVSCFVVRREHRGSGVGAALLEGAVDWAAQHGASVLDGHPVDTGGQKGAPSPSAVFTGTLVMFQRAGFSLNKTHGRNRLLVGPGFDLLLAPGAIMDTERGQCDRAHRNEAQQKQDPA